MKTTKKTSAYEQFRETVEANGWTLAELRCDVRPSEELLEVMDQIGLGQYERFVVRLEREGVVR